MNRIPLRFHLNDAEIGEFIDSGTTLLSLLRDKLGLTATKSGCNQGSCGACTVLINGAPQLSCLVLAARCEGKSVATLEGVSDNGTLHPLQRAFMDGFAAQCGFCTPGMIIAAKALLDRNPDPDRGEVIDAISGNICRCTGYEPIIDAILAAAAEMRGGKRKSA
ncbi:MAG: (2Fe-2S)-binding protein [Rhizobiales bacterium]|nr:(2Fe-2S)-binding protein [Hyphomicrobiales bacterium]